jgi:penicillin-binding protein 1A
LKRFLQRLSCKLLVILNFGWRYLLKPLVDNGRKKSYTFFKQHQPKLTLSYWQQKTSKLRHYYWSEVHAPDFAFLWQGALRLVLLSILGFFLFYLVVYLGLLGGMPS